MSEQQFKEARGQLAFSQSLVDKMKTDQAPQKMQQEQGMQPQSPQQEAPQSGEQVGDIKSTIEETLTPFMDKIESLISKEDDKVRQVEIKLDGEMSPAEDLTKE